MYNMYYDVLCVMRVRPELGYDEICIEINVLNQSIIKVLMFINITLLCTRNGSIIKERAFSM